jgi:hypothetical protein
MLVLPHADVVLHALCYVANSHKVHPWEIVRGYVQRPVLMHWLNRRTVSLSYQNMQSVIAVLTHDHAVNFLHDSFSVANGLPVRAHGLPIPYSTNANPSAA